MRSSPQFNSAPVAVAIAVLTCITPVFCGEIHDAVGSGDLGKVRALLQSNPDVVFAKDNSGMTALHWAADRGFKNIVTSLLANSADINARRNDGETPLHLAVRSVRPGHKDVAALLLANHADVNAVDKDGWIAAAPPFAADWGDDNDVEQLLLAYRPNINAKAAGGFTPLHFAVAAGFPEKAELLLVNRADVNALDNKGETPLQVVTSRSRDALVQLLREHGGHE